MTAEEFIEYVEKRIRPYTFRENGRARLSDLYRKYSESLLLECVDIGIQQYFCYDEEGVLIQESAQEFLNKLGGIAYNKSQSPIEQEIKHQKNKCRKLYPYWNDHKADEILRDYICALREIGWSDESILEGLKTEVNRISGQCRNWTQWSEGMRNWIDDIRKWNDEDSETIEQFGTIIPDTVKNNTPVYIQKMIEQINASYENNLFDCCAVMMRRLLEVLLILSFQNMGIENEILDDNGVCHVTLGKIIQNAEQNVILALSGSTKEGMNLFKDLGDFSAHKIWYNCTQQDIEPQALKYRAIIEELIYKAGLK